VLLRPATRGVEVSPEFRELVGLGLGETVTLEKLIEVMGEPAGESLLSALRDWNSAGDVERDWLQKEHWVGVTGTDGHTRRRLVQIAEVGRGADCTMVLTFFDPMSSEVLSEAADALDESRERYRLACQAVEGMIYDWDVRTGICRRSAGITEILGVAFGSDEPTAAWWQSRAHPEDYRIATETVNRLAAEGAETVETRYRIRHEDGRWVWILDRQRLVRDETGAVIRGVGASKDITAEVEAAETIAHLTQQRHEVLARLNALIDSAPIGIAVLDGEGRFEMVNSQLATMSGVETQGHLGRSFGEVSPELTRRLGGHFKTVMTTGRTLSGVIVSSEGMHAGDAAEVREWHQNWFPIAGDDGRTRSVGLTVQEVTDQRRAERALRRSESGFRLLTEAMPQMVWTCHLDGHCTYVSSQWERSTGQTAAEAVGWGWTAVIHPEDRERNNLTWMEAVRSLTPFVSEYRMRMSDGSFRWHLARGHRMQPEAGLPEQWIGTTTDIEDQKKAAALLARDVEQLEELVAARTRDLEQAHHRERFNERMTLMGTLAAGLGHDLGNLLLPARMRLNSMAREANPATIGEDVRAISASLDYAQRLSNGLRLMAVDSDLSKTRGHTVMADWWSQAEPLLRAVLPAHIALEGNISASPLSAAIAATQLMQAVFNLVNNAGNAIGLARGGRVRVDAFPIDGEVGVAISDNGPGMSPEIVTRCMEPYFTTSAKPTSTGLGLQIVAATVKQAGGRIEVRSAQGAGTTFVIRLQLAEPQPPTEAATTTRAAGAMRRSAE